MRGRTPQALTIARPDRPVLEHLARSQSAPWFQVRRARTVLAIAAGQRTGEVAARMQCDADTVRRTCRRYAAAGLAGLLAPRSDRAARPGFPPLEELRIVRLACLEPVARGLHITHWTSADLARQAVADGIVRAVSPRTVRRLLAAVELQPHRTRFWKTATLDDQFLRRAIKILWCYTHAGHLARAGYWVVCADELPNFQVLERRPIRRAVPGSIEQREFEYRRHGVVHLLVFLAVHTGRMEAACVETKDATHYVAALRHFRRRHRHLNGVYLVHDNDGSHIAGETRDYLHEHRRWFRVCPTPPHASWLNQAELLLDSFELHYLKRGSWQSRDALVRHVAESWPEYNSRYAHPFAWHWSIPKMRQWFTDHAP